MQTLLIYFILAGAIVAAGPQLGPSLASAQSDTTNPSKESDADPRFRSPRATVRTFLAAINATADDPNHLDDAIACLDMSEVASNPTSRGRFAFELEHILRSIKVPTPLIPDQVDGAEYVLSDQPNLKITLHRQPDGRWLFDAETVNAIPKMRRLTYQMSLDAPKPKENNAVASSYRSPRALFNTFITALKKGDLNSAAKCFDLRDVPAPARLAVGRDLAAKLKEVLDRTIFIIFQDVPDESANEPLEAVVRREGRIVIERQPDGPRAGQWLFNQTTVDSMDRLYDASESLPLMPELVAMGASNTEPSFRRSSGLWLRRQVPDFLKSRIHFTERHSLALYQIVGATLLIALIYPLFRLTTVLFARLLFAAFRCRNETLDTETPILWSRSIGLVAVSWLLIDGVKILDFHHNLSGFLLMILIPIFWLATTLLLYRSIEPSIRLLLGSTSTSPGASTRAAMGFPVISLVLKISVIAFGMFSLLELFDVDVTTALAGLGIGGLAFALAAQDTLKNFFGSVMLISDRTFRVGDRVRIGANEGIVETVGLRSTRIRGLDNSLLTVPNSDLTTQHIANHGAPLFRSFRTTISTAYGTPLERVVEFRDGIRQLVEQNPRIRQDKFEVAVHNLASSSIDILLQVQFDVPNEHAELAAREDLILGIVHLADRLGIAPLCQRNPT